MAEWRTTTLGELCDEGGGGIQTGPFGSQLHASDYVPHGVPSVMPVNIGDNVILEHGIARITPEDAARLSRYSLAEGDIVYSRRGDVERRALVRREQSGWLCGTGCLRVRLGTATSADPRFVSYLLGTEEIRAWIVRHAVGATMPNLNTSILRSVPLSVPPLSEQRAIAEVLGALDDKIAANDRMVRNADSLTLALAAEAPRDTALRDIATVARSMVDPASLVNDVVDLYSLPGFDAGRLPEAVAPESIKSGKFTISSPAVLVSKLNPRIPRVWEVPTCGTTPALGSTEFVVLHPMDTSTAVLWALLAQPSFSASLEAKVAGTSGSHQRVKPDEVLSTLIGNPASLGEGRRAEIDALRARTHAALSENVRLSATRDALLPALMSGALRVKDAERLAEDLT